MNPSLEAWATWPVWVRCKISYSLSGIWGAILTERRVAIMFIEFARCNIPPSYGNSDTAG